MSDSKLTTEEGVVARQQESTAREMFGVQSPYVFDQPALPVARRETATVLPKNHAYHSDLENDSHIEGIAREVQWRTW